jgi:acetyl esterase/lipase
MADFSAYDGPSSEWLAIEATLPPRPTTIDTLAFKKATNDFRDAASAAAFAPLKDQLDVADHTIVTRDGFNLEARSYRPKGVDGDLPVYMHFHGGGFIFGTLDSENAACARIALSLKDSAPVVVLNVNYRHTPEWKYPYAWDDAIDAFIWTHKNLSVIGGDGSKVILGGISAGARLIASLIVSKALDLAPELKGLPDVQGQLLFIPSLIHQDCHGGMFAKLADPSKASSKIFEEAPVIPKKVLRWFTDLLEVAEPKEDDLKMSPGNVTEEQLQKVKSRIPPTVSGIAGYDPLRDDGLVFAKDLAEAG